MDQLVSHCQDKLESFRVKELKDVLTRIGAAKQGKRQVLIDKIMAVLQSHGKQQYGSRGLRPESSARHSISPEEVAKVIDDVYRKMRGSSALDLATTGDGLSHSRTLGQLSDLEAPLRRERTEKICCPCGSKVKRDTMLQCDSAKCMVWQHMNCVIIPEKEGLIVEPPTLFYCELCRLQLGDPYHVSVSHPLLATKLVTSIPSSEGSNPVQKLEKSFILSQNDRDLIRKPHYDLQIWSMLLNDKAVYRMHWPLHTELIINGCPVRVTNRPGHQALGINGRDDGVVITDYVRDGSISISLGASDGRPFCIGIRVIQRLTVDQVLSRIPSEAEGETFDTALARVRRCLGGGGGEVDNGNDSDSDLEVISENVFVNLRCPMSGSRIRIAGRFKSCAHMGCFDLHTLVESNQRTRKWQCPICLTNHSLEDLIIDPFLTRIVKAMKNYGEDVTEVEMKPDGSWRPKSEGDSKLQELWRTPDGLSDIPKGENQHNWRLVTVKAEAEESLPVEKVPLKIGIKRTRDGTWQVKPTSGYSHVLNNGSFEPNSLLGSTDYSRSSSMTANTTDIPGLRRGQEALQLLKMAETEVNSIPTEVSPFRGSGVVVPELESTKDAEVIILSDSEEENGDECNLREVNDTRLSVQQDNDRLYETADVPLLEMDSFRESHVDFFQSNREESTPSAGLWPLHTRDSSYESLVPPTNIVRKARSTTSTQTGQHMNHGYQSHQQKRNALSEARMYNGYARASDYQSELMESGRELLPSSDPSLHMFLPHQPARASRGYTNYESSATPREDIQDGWFSLGVGSDQRESSTHHQRGSSSAHRSSRIGNSAYNDERDFERFDPVANSASVLLNLSSQTNAPTSTQRRSHSVAAHRSSGHRHRRYFPVESESDD